MPDCPACGQPIETNEEKIVLKETAIRLLFHVNQVGFKSFRPIGTSLVLIIERLKSGVSEEDCRRVIEYRWKAWKGTENEQYFRPATLFNKTKFEQYLGMLPKKKSEPVIKSVVPDESPRTPEEIAQAKEMLAGLIKSIGRPTILE